MLFLKFEKESQLMIAVIILVSLQLKVIKYFKSYNNKSQTKGLFLTLTVKDIESLNKDYNF